MPCEALGSDSEYRQMCIEGQQSAGSVVREGTVEEDAV